MSDISAQYPLQERTIAGAGVKLHCFVQGPEDGDLVVMLHGFPEHAGSWLKYLPALCSAGYLVVAPDQRGYNTSERPKHVKDYGVDALTDDIVALIRALGREQAHIVGHDWGGVIAWWLAHARPKAVRTVSILNVPHPDVMRKHVLFGSLKQMFRSWYVYFFQLPWLPDKLLAANNCQILRNALADTSIDGAISEDELQTYVDAWQQPGAVTAMLNWYRASLTTPPKRPQENTFDAPLLLLWGDQDHVLGTEMVDASAEIATNATVVHFPDATHWVNHEKVAEITPLLLEHFAS